MNDRAPSLAAAFLALSAALTACEEPPTVDITRSDARRLPRLKDGGIDLAGTDPDSRSSILRAGGGLDGGAVLSGSSGFDGTLPASGPNGPLGPEGPGAPDGSGAVGIDGPGGPGLPDGDGDGAPDPFDCDPQSSVLGMRIAEDDLATAKGLVLAAPGFDATAWVHASGAYRQTRLHNAPDASFLQVPIGGNFVVDVRVAADQVGAFYPKLRQQLVLVGASSTGGGFTGYGCGIEVVEGGATEFKTSLVRLGGSTTSVVTTPIRRVDRPGVAVGTDVGINVAVTGSTITCTVTQGTSATTVAATDAAFAGTAVGFYTRQTKASFSRVRVCAVR